MQNWRDDPAVEYCPNMTGTVGGDIILLLDFVYSLPDNVDLDLSIIIL